MADRAAPPAALDPPFRGMINNTHDALLVFEAARRGMIPRVTRRLIDRERAMVQSGAVFVFDEHESGIKRWTDGLLWSPSRILGNFLIYRETVKEPKSDSPKKKSASPPSEEAEASTRPAALSGGELRGRSTTDGRLALAGGRTSIDRHMERILVGSLTNSYNFKQDGLVKKTMSVTVNGFNQHLVSYYTVEDAAAGRLRSPSTIPELAALEISQDYLQRTNFRFPPQTDIGPDGLLRYRGETDDSTAGAGVALPAPAYDPQAGPSMGAPIVQRARSVTAPSAGMAYGYAPGPAGYYDAPMQTPGSLSRHNSTASSMSPTTTTTAQSQGVGAQPIPGGGGGPGVQRPTSSHRMRYDPYSSPRHGHSRRMSTSAYSSGGGPPPDIDSYYGYAPPATAPSSMPSSYYVGPEMGSPAFAAPAYQAAWPADPSTPTSAATQGSGATSQGAGPTSRLLPATASAGSASGATQHAHGLPPPPPMSGATHPRDPMQPQPPRAHHGHAPPPAQHPQPHMGHAQADWLHGFQHGWHEPHPAYPPPHDDWRGSNM